MVPFPLLAATLCATIVCAAHAFVVPPYNAQVVGHLVVADPATTTAVRLAKSADSLSSPTKATLTAETTWQLRIAFRNIATKNGQRMDNVMFVVTGQFIEEEGYEPPQGFFQQQERQEVSLIAADTGESYSAIGTSQLKIVQSRWKLSEDPNDRKDGLWVWGLFKEPLYPFMLLQLETAAISLPNNDSIAPLQLFAQIKHKRVENTAVLEAITELNIRQSETIKADPFGVSQVDVYEEVSIGSLSIQALG
jgi:hypothetical protein